MCARGYVRVPACAAVCGPVRAPVRVRDRARSLWDGCREVPPLRASVAVPVLVSYNTRLLAG